MQRTGFGTEQRPDRRIIDRGSSPNPSARPGRPWRTIRVFALVLLVLWLLPYAVVPFYRFVDPGSTLMVWRWLKGAPVERIWVNLDAVAPILRVSVIASEDAHFCTHHGVDWGEIRGVIQEADDFGDLRGGSTITQQTVKNLFLWPGRSILRKVVELPLSMWTELVLPKRRIFELYLNVAEWGPSGQFGVEAAARRAFGKSAAGLDAREAALLAAVLPNPRRRDARKPRPGLQRLANRYQIRARAMARQTRCVLDHRTAAK